MVNKSELNYLRKIHSKVGKTIKEKQLIEKDDRVLVGISGGKDSLVLLDILSERLSFLPINYEIIPVHVRVKQLHHLVEIEYLEEFCKERNLSILIEEVDVDLENTKGKKACFVCSWNRRKTLFQLAEKLNCNKLALGHHMDDVIETLLMNMTFNGEISAFPSKLKIRKGNFHIIRPLLKNTNDEILRFSDIKGFNISEEKCPHEDNNKREFFKAKVKEISDLHNLAKVNLFNSMSNIIEEYLPD
jgi:tRNA 2-thiocytidine biosynthesis protein TtcA